MKRLFIIAAALAATLLSASAQESVTVHVAGQSLESLLTDEQKQSVRSLTVTGTLAEADYAYLRSGLLNQLDTLNLRQAEIDTIPAKAFCTDIDGWLTVVLPLKLRHLSDNALCVGKAGCKFVLTGGFPTLGKDVFAIPPQGIRNLDFVASADNMYCKTIAGAGIYSADGTTLYYGDLGNVDEEREYSLAIDGTRIIGANAYENCRMPYMKSVPASVDSIGDRAFANTYMVAFTSATLPAVYFVSYAVNPPKLGDDVFLNAENAFVDVAVPTGSVELYKSAFGWNELQKIVGLDDFSTGVSHPQSKVGGSLSVTGNAVSCILNSSQAMTSVSCFSVGGTVLYSKKCHATTVEIPKPFGHDVCAIKVEYVDGSCETLKVIL